MPMCHVKAQFRHQIKIPSLACIWGCYGARWPLQSLVTALHSNYPKTPNHLVSYCSQHNYTDHDYQSLRFWKKIIEQSDFTMDQELDS